MLGAPAEHSYLVCSRHNAAISPRFCIFVRKKLSDARNNLCLIWRMKTQEQNAVMRARREFPGVRKIHILRDEKSLFGLCRRPYFTVGLARKSFVARRMDIVTEPSQNR